jgi:hypothetical protein
MPEVVRQIAITDSDKLPEDLRDFVRIEEVESGSAYGFDAEGNKKQIRKAGHTIVDFALMGGAAEEISGEDMNPAMRMIFNELQHTNHLLETMQTELGTLRAKMTRYEDGVDGYNIGDSVAWQQQEDEKESYETGYVVVGYTDEKIKIRNPETGDIHEVDSGVLAHEEDLDNEELDIIAPGDILTYTPSAGASEPGWVATSGIWSDRDGAEFVTARSPSGVERHLRYEEISIGDDVPPPPPADTPGQRPGRFNRFLMTPNLAIGRGMTNLMTRRTTTVTEYDAAGRPVNEVVNRSGVGALGGAAIAGAGVLVGYLIWGRHGGHNYGPDIASLRLHEKQNQAAILAHARADKVNDAAQIKAAIAANNKADRVKDAAQIKAAVAAQERAEEAQGASGGLQGSSVGHNGNSLHTYYYDGDPGHRKTGLKSNVLRLLGRPGHKYLVDNNGHVVLNHVQWDQQRKLSVLDRARLKSKGFNLGTGLLSRGYTTIITRD